MASPKAAYNEDKVALMIGCLVFVLALGKMVGLDIMGWVVRVGMWVDNPLDAWRAATWKGLPGWGALLVSYAVITGLLAFGIKLIRGNVANFIRGFTIIFFMAIACYTLGANAYIAANPTQLAKQGIPWALGLSTEAGLIVALLVGIMVGNFTPKFAESLREACRPELFVKIAIVIMGAELGVKAADAAGFAGHIIFRGLCAIVEALLVRCLLRCPQALQVQQRMGRASCFRDFHLRRFCGHCHRRRHPRPACDSDHGVFAGRGVYLHRNADPALRGPALPCS